ncbi:helix-turn-helix transcriptional regulator [Rhodococcus sp. NPDC060090]|uniref:helix-turn-helix transcriptional regulator n=1 Tax=Rhodococcus sp. NPDC060090 TaxID=3347056 RepID=UPI003648D865
MIDEPVLLLTKSDIASLAGVQRPVVSVWRTRYNDTDRPFPQPVRIDARQERFAAADVVDWLKERKLGNNDALAEDVAIHAALDHPTDADPESVFAGITALLCLKAQLGTPLADLDGDDILDEADNLDPDDAYLYRELDALGDHLVTYARHADRMADAAYTPERAFEALMSQRFRRPMPELAASTLAAGAHELCVSVATALVYDDRAAFVDPSIDSSDLFVALRKELSEDIEPIAITGRANTASARLARRRLAMHRWRRHPAPEGGFGNDFSIDRPALFLTQYPSPSTLGYSPIEMLTEVDNITVQMSSEHYAVVIAPAAVLVDPVRDRDTLSIRSGILRSGRLRAAIRLPEGLLVTKPGTAMALWVLGAADAQIAPADQWTVLADVSDRPLDHPTIDGVVSDVVAAMGSWDSVCAHAFQFGAIYRTADLLADDGRGLVATRHVRPSGRGDEVASRVMSLVDATNSHAHRIEGDLRVTVEYDRAGVATLPTAGDLVAQHKLSLVPGNRIDEGDLEPDGKVRAIGPAELLGERVIGERGVDRLVHTTKYPSSRYSEPGDIVFCTSPRFGITIDAEGSSLVVAPARVLRVRNGAVDGLVPEVIVRHVKKLAAVEKPTGAIRAGRRWKDWTIPVIAPDRVGAVVETLREFDTRRREAQNLLDSVNELTDTMIDGVTRGVLSVTVENRHVPEEG